MVRTCFKLEVFEQGAMIGISTTVHQPQEFLCKAVVTVEATGFIRTE
jgi:hypothetical protein